MNSKENVCIIISRGNTMAELKLENIYKIYDNNVTAVTDFNLHIQDKEFIVFVDSFWMRKIYNITNGSWT